MPGRAELALINRELAAAMAQRDEAQRLLDQWQGRESEMATVELQLAQLRAQRVWSNDVSTELRSQAVVGTPSLLLVSAICGSLEKIHSLRVLLPLTQERTRSRGIGGRVTVGAFWGGVSGKV